MSRAKRSTAHVEILTADFNLDYIQRWPKIKKVYQNINEDPVGSRGHSFANSQLLPYPAYSLNDLSQIHAQ